MTVDQMPELAAAKFDKLKTVIPQDQIEAWNKQYRLAVPPDTTFLQMLYWIYNDTLPKQRRTRKNERCNTL